MSNRRRRRARDRDDDDDDDDDERVPPHRRRRLEYQAENAFATVLAFACNLGLDAEVEMLLDGMPMLLTPLLLPRVLSANPMPDSLQLLLDDARVERPPDIVTVACDRGAGRRLLRRLVNAGCRFDANTLLSAVKRGDPELVAWLLLTNVDDATDNAATVAEALNVAARAGSVSEVSFLIPHVDDAGRTSALLEALSHDKATAAASALLASIPMEQVPTEVIETAVVHLRYDIASRLLSIPAMARRFAAVVNGATVSRIVRYHRDEESVEAASAIAGLLLRTPPITASLLLSDLLTLTIFANDLRAVRTMIQAHGLCGDTWTYILSIVLLLNDGREMLRLLYELERHRVGVDAFRLFASKDPLVPKKAKLLQCLLSFPDFVWQQRYVDDAWDVSADACRLLALSRGCPRRLPEYMVRRITHRSADNEIRLVDQAIDTLLGRRFDPQSLPVLMLRAVIREESALVRRVEEAIVQSKL